MLYQCIRYCAVYWRKFTIERQEKLEQKFDTPFGKALELTSVFKEASRNFILHFLPSTRQTKYLKTLCAWTESTNLVCIGLQTDPSGDPITSLPVNDSTNTFMIIFLQ
jgi:hypothetical protein